MSATRHENKGNPAMHAREKKLIRFLGLAQISPKRRNYPSVLVRFFFA